MQEIRVRALLLYIIVVNERVAYKVRFFEILFLIRVLLIDFIRADFKGFIFRELQIRLLELFDDFKVHNVNEIVYLLECYVLYV